MRDITKGFKVLSKQARNPLFHSLFANYDSLKREMTIQNIRPMGNDDFKVKVEIISIDFVRGLAKSTNQANFLLGLVSRELFTPDAVQRFRIPE